MAQKNDSSIPRRAYRTHGMTVVCFGGAFYGRKDSAVNIKLPVKVTKGEKGELSIVQRAPKKAAVSETWRKVNI